MIRHVSHAEHYATVMVSLLFKIMEIGLKRLNLFKQCAVFEKQCKS